MSFDLCHSDLTNRDLHFDLLKHSNLLNFLWYKYNIKSKPLEIMENESDWVQHISCDPMNKIIWIPRYYCTNSCQLVATLHETGHGIKHDNNTLKELNESRNPRILEIEAEAWIWALEFMGANKIELNDLMRLFMVSSINTYWQAKQLNDFSGEDSEYWCLFLDIVGTEYNNAVNKWDVIEW